MLEASRKTPSDGNGQDFSFIDELQSFNSHTGPAVNSNDRVDIRITSGSVTIEFDGLLETSNYGTPDFTVSFPDTLGSVADNLDIYNFFGIPAYDEITLADFNDSTLIPDTELFRFDSLKLHAPASVISEIFVKQTDGSASLTEYLVADFFNTTGEFFVGTPSADTYTGDGRNPLLDDLVVGFEGNDVLSGLEGDDIITGGAGDDSINGGNGDDVLAGNWGGLEIPGSGSDDDTIDGGAGNDQIAGDHGNYSLSGGDDDLIDGGYGNDTIDGGDGNDIIDGGEGNDILTGGQGQDIFTFTDRSVGDIITDFSTQDDAVQLEAAFFSGVESLTGGTPLIDTIYTTSSGGSTILVEGQLLALLRNAIDVPLKLYTTTGSSSVNFKSSATVPTGQIWDHGSGSLRIFSALSTTSVEATNPYTQVLVERLTEMYFPTFFVYRTTDNAQVFTDVRAVAFAQVSNALGTDHRLLWAYITNNRGGTWTGTNANMTGLGNHNRITANEIVAVSTIARFSAFTGTNLIDLLFLPDVVVI